MTTYPTPTSTSAAASTRLAAGERLYQALGAGDAAVLRELLREDFQGHLTSGLPHGFGRTYDGREAMLTDGWGALGAYFAVSPQVEELLEAGEYLVGRGVYVGTAKETGKPIAAGFAHFWRFEGDRIVSVHQVTDSALWHQALQP